MATMGTPAAQQAAAADYLDRPVSNILTINSTIPGYTNDYRTIVNVTGASGCVELLKWAESNSYGRVSIWLDGARVYYGNDEQFTVNLKPGEAPASFGRLAFSESLKIEISRAYGSSSTTQRMIGRVRVYSND